MIINATLINLFNVCPRECWLHANGIRMEQTSDLVAQGKNLEMRTYPQRVEKYKQISLSGEFEGIQLSGQIDFFDSIEKIIHETKRGDKVEHAHILQVKFYLWLFQLNKIEVNEGIIEYPKLRTTTPVTLSQSDIKNLKETVKKVNLVINSAQCPPVLNSKICKSCSYYEFCYVKEGDTG